MSVVIDASVFVMTVTDSGALGQWAEATIGRSRLYAPECMPAEASNVLRRLERAGMLDARASAAAFDELKTLRIEPVRWAPYADRIWSLRANVTTFDAWYVAVAESMAIPLATADLKLARATGPRCDFLLAPLH